MHVTRTRGGQLSLLPVQLSAAQAQGQAGHAPKARILKKRRRKKKARGATLGQLSGMTDEDKSAWMLKHCKVCDCLYWAAPLLMAPVITAWRPHIVHFVSPLVALHALFCHLPRLGPLSSNALIVHVRVQHSHRFCISISKLPTRSITGGMNKGGGRRHQACIRGALTRSAAQSTHCVICKPPFTIFP